MLIGWFYIIGATIAELLGIIGLSLYSQKRTLPRWLLYYGGIAVSFMLLYFSFEFLPVSIAYTVLTGAGTAGAVILNIFFFGESRNIFRLLSLFFIIIGVMGLKYTSSYDEVIIFSNSQKEVVILTDEQLKSNVEIEFS